MTTLEPQHHHPPHAPVSGCSSRLLVNSLAQRSESSQAVTVSLSSHREAGEAGQDGRAGAGDSARPSLTWAPARVLL